MSASEAEGFVINIDDWRVKLKYDDYCRLHRFLASALSNNHIIKYMITDMIDDVISKLPKEYQTEVIDKMNAILDMEYTISKIVHNLYNQMDTTLDRKDFFIKYIQENESKIPKVYLNYISTLYLNKPIHILSKSHNIPISYKELLSIRDTGLNYMEERHKEDEIELE